MEVPPWGRAGRAGKAAGAAAPYDPPRRRGRQGLARERIQYRFRLSIYEIYPGLFLGFPVGDDHIFLELVNPLPILILR